MIQYREALEEIAEVIRTGRRFVHSFISRILIFLKLTALS
jgi:hypothetical protein